MFHTNFSKSGNDENDILDFDSNTILYHTILKDNINIKQYGIMTKEKSKSQISIVILKLCKIFFSYSR